MFEIVWAAVQFGDSSIEIIPQFHWSECSIYQYILYYCCNDMFLLLTCINVSSIFTLTSGNNGIIIIIIIIIYGLSDLDEMRAVSFVL